MFDLKVCESDSICIFEFQLLAKNISIYYILTINNDAITTSIIPVNLSICFELAFNIFIIGDKMDTIAWIGFGSFVGILVLTYNLYKDDFSDFFKY